MILNNKIVFDNDFYAVAKSHNDKKVCYITKKEYFNLVNCFFDKFPECSYISLIDDPWDLYTIAYPNLNISTFLADINKALEKNKDSDLLVVESKGERFFVSPIHYYKSWDNDLYSFSNHRFYLDSGDIGGKAGYFILPYDKYKTAEIQETICILCGMLDLYCNKYAFNFTVYDSKDQVKPIQQEERLIHPCDFVSFIQDHYFDLAWNDLSFKGQLKVYI